MSDTEKDSAIVERLEDGTIVISDGWGAEIRLVRGSIELRCTGDVKMVAAKQPKDTEAGGA